MERRRAPVLFLTASAFATYERSLRSRHPKRCSGLTSRTLAISPVAPPFLQVATTGRRRGFIEWIGRQGARRHSLGGAPDVPRGIPATRRRAAAARRYHGDRSVLRQPPSSRGCSRRPRHDAADARRGRPRRVRPRSSPRRRRWRSRREDAGHYREPRRAFLACDPSCRPGDHGLRHRRVGSRHRSTRLIRAAGGPRPPPAFSPTQPRFLRAAAAPRIVDQALAASCLRGDGQSCRLHSSAQCVLHERRRGGVGAVVGTEGTASSRERANGDGRAASVTIRGLDNHRRPRRQPRAGLSELARRVGIAKARPHRTCFVLVGRGLSYGAPPARPLVCLFVSLPARQSSARGRCRALPLPSECATRSANGARIGSLRRDVVTRTRRACTPCVHRATRAAPVHRSTRPVLAATSRSAQQAAGRPPRAPATRRRARFFRRNWHVCSAATPASRRTARESSLRSPSDSHSKFRSSPPSRCWGPCPHAGSSDSRHSRR